MKNLNTLVFIIAFFQIKATAQDTIYNMSDADFEHLFDGISNLENLSTNYLKNKTVDFIPLEKYSGIHTDSNCV